METFDILPRDVSSLPRDLLEIYHRSIPANERKDDAALLRMLRSAEWTFTVISDGTAASGFAVMFAPVDLDFGLLEYLAVAPEHRSRGMGRRLFGSTIDQLRRDRPNLPVLIEVDAVRPGDFADAQCARRVRFYRSLGCVRFIGLDYMLPLRVGSTPPPPMELMICLPLHASGSNSVPRETVQHWLHAIYVRVYGQPPDDPRLADMMRLLPDPVCIA